MPGYSNRSLLIARLLNGQAGKRQASGFSMAVVLLVLFVSVISAVALATRSSSGQAGALTLSAKREAREAAESGITAIVGELNKVQNRRLLVSGTSPNAWGSQTNPTQRNPCLNTGATAVPPLTSANPAGSNGWRSIGSGNGQFILKSVRFANRDRTQRLKYEYSNSTATTASITENTNPPYDNNSAGNANGSVNLDPVAAAGSENFGFIQIEVQGRVVRGTNTIATATVVKEFQVIPKCCSRSYSGPANSANGSPLYSFGNDQRTCSSGLGDLGLVAGFNNGSINVNGTAGSIREVDTSGNITTGNIESILCVTTSTSTPNNCTSPSSTNPIPVSGGGTIPLIPTIFSPDPPPVFTGASSTPAANISSGAYIRISTSNTVQSCTYNQVSNQVSSCTPLTSCVQRADPVANFQCRIARIRLTGSSDRLIFDTSRGTLALFVDEPNGEVTIGGSASLLHRYCSTPPNGNSGCNTRAPESQFTRLSFYSSQSNTSFQFQGGSETAAFFIYFPNSSVTIAGNSLAAGAIWSKNLTLNGSFTSAAPATNCSTASNGFCYLARGSQAGGSGGASGFLFDWIARSPVTTRVY